LGLAVAGYNEATIPAVARTLVERVRALPRVEHATMAVALPGGFESISLGGLAVTGVQPPRGARLFQADCNVVEPGYFATMRMPLVAGRDFNETDRQGTQPVAIIGEGAARRFWPGRDPIGQVIFQQSFAPKAPPGRSLTVIGVARDPKYGTLVDVASGLYAYVPLQQYKDPRGWIMIVARTTDGRRISDDIRDVVKSVNPNIQIRDTQTADQYTALGLLPQRIAALVAASLGAVGLLLSAIGIYGMTAYAVEWRTREIGIRVALGAARADVVMLVLGEGMSLGIAGAVSGLALAVVVGRLLTSYLYGVSPLDLLTLGGSSVLFVLLALVACYMPLRRAMTIHPIQALRYE
jgi:predicted permease